MNIIEVIKILTISDISNFFLITMFFSIIPTILEEKLEWEKLFVYIFRISAFLACLFSFIGLYLFIFKGVKS